MRSKAGALRAAAMCAVAVFVLTACGSSSAKSGTRPTDDPAPIVYAVQLTDAGCTPDNFTVHPGLVEFRVTNSGSTEVEEMEVQTSNGHVVNDVEGVRPGTTRSFVVKLQAGKYRVRCPEEARTGGTITVK